MTFNLRARVVAEFLGTAFLLAAVVGSGIMGERLASGNLAIALLANTLATGAALLALILTFNIISGANCCPGRRCFHWSGCGAHHVRAAAVLPVPSRPEWGRPFVERVHRYLRIALGHLGMLSHPAHSSGLCRGSLYHCGLLVHGFDFFCQSRGYTGPRCQRHLRRDSSC